MAVLKLKVEGVLPKCLITGLDKKAVIKNVAIDTNGLVSIESEALWIGLDGTELTVAISNIGREQLRLVEKADTDGDFPLTSKFKQDIELALKNFQNGLLAQQLEINN